MLRDVEYFGALGHITNRCTRLLRARLFNVTKLACGVFATANVALQAPYQRVSSSVSERKKANSDEMVLDNSRCGYCCGVCGASNRTR